MNRLNNIFNLKTFREWSDLYDSDNILINKNFCSIDSVSNECLNSIILLMSKGLLKYYFKCWSVMPEVYFKIFPEEEPIQNPRIAFAGNISHFAAVRDFVRNRRKIIFLNEHYNLKNPVSIDDLPYNIKCRILDYPFDSVWFDISSRNELNIIANI